MKSNYIPQRNLDWEDRHFDEEDYQNDLILTTFRYLAIFVFVIVFMTNYSRTPESTLNMVLNKLKNKNDKQAKKSLKPALQNKEEKTHQKQHALAKVEVKTEKHWADKKDDFNIDEEYLKQLDEILSQEEWLNSPKSEEISQGHRPRFEGKEEQENYGEIKERIKMRRTATFAKKEQPTDTISTAPGPKEGATDKLLMWDTKLPGYNLTKHVSTDPNRSVYPLGSGNRFVFINKYLRLFLASNHSEALDRLLHICEIGRDQLHNKSRNQSGFIIKEEGNAGILDKSIAKKIIDDKECKNEGNKDKNEETNKDHKGHKDHTDNSTYYVKVKDCVKDYRFFGSSVATINQKKVLFEVNGFKPTHKKSEKITYFPSEAPKLK